MADEWYYAKGKERIGPLSAAQLRQLARSGELARTSMVWKTGMPKWVQAGQVDGLFAETPPVTPATVPPPLPDELPDERPTAVPTPDELKLPAVGMFVVSGMALFFGLLGVVGADSPVVRVLQAVGIAHNLAALALTFSVVRLRSYTVASVSPWVVMTCWLWHWLSNLTHGVPLLGMVLAVSAGVWAYLVLRRPDVRRAFDADPHLPPLFGGRQAPAYTPEPGTRFPWPVEERTASNPKLMWLKVAIAASIVVGVLLLVTIVGAIFCLPFFSLAYLIHFFGVSRGRLHGRWVPVEGASGWVEFLPGGILKREDGTVGTFALLPNQKFIDLLASGHLVDSWKILAWGTDTLEVQDMAGRARSFKKGKTLEERQLFSTDRSSLLQRKWEPVDGSGPAVQFTQDGAMIRFDGFAARYTFSGEEPNEVITVHIDDARKVVLRVLSLGRDEMVLAGEGGACHYRRGTSITDAESQRRMDAAKERLMQVGKAVAVTGAVVVGIAVLGVAAAAGAGGSGGSGYDGGGGGGFGGGDSASAGDRRQPSPTGAVPVRAQQVPSVSPVPATGGRQRKVAALRGVVIVSDDGGMVTYRKKCEKCGHVEPGTTRMAISSGNMRSSFMCSHCKQIQETDIQATS